MAYYETYLYAGLVYLVAALGMYYVVVKFTKYWANRDVVNFLRMVAAVILFTPAFHTMDGNTAMAPAFIISAGELLTNGPKAAMMGVVPLMGALFVGALLLTIQALWNSRKSAKG